MGRWVALDLLENVQIEAAKARDSSVFDAMLVVIATEE